MTLRYLGHDKNGTVYQDDQTKEIKVVRNSKEPPQLVKIYHVWDEKTQTCLRCRISKIEAVREQKGCV